MGPNLENMWCIYKKNQSQSDVIQFTCSTRDHCSRDWRSYEHMDCSYFCMTYENQTTLDCRLELFSTLQQKLQSLDSAHYSTKRYGTKSNPEGVVDQTISSRSTQLCIGV